MNRLHITNGDSTGNSLEASTLDGEVLPWRDVLHDGPVPGGLSISELAQIRAEFLVSNFPVMSVNRILESIAERDALMARLDDFDEVTLWFEHDLYDQLQILEIMNRLHDAPPAKARLSMICINAFDGIDRFLGLGQLNPKQLASLDPTRHDVTDAELELSVIGWRAFTSDDPQRLNDLLSSDTSALPFLDAALQRFVAQYPSVRDGLSLTQRYILELVGDDTAHPGQLFAEFQERETAPYLGDWSYYKEVEQLTHAPTPALRCAPGPEFVHPPGGADWDAFAAQRLSLTDFGRDLLSGAADWVDVNGADHWCGGVHLTGEPDWRDGGHGHVIARGA